MKRSIFKLIIILALTLGYACEDNLDLAPISSISSSSFWQTEDDAVAALYGMYSQFRSTLNNGDRILYWMELRTGFWFNGTSGGAGAINNVYANNLDATMDWTNWATLYTLINDCNLILKYVPDIEFSNENLKNEVLGHAHFCRAYAYFKLAQIWGDVPIVTEGFESVNQELYNPRQPVADVYTLVKEDVEIAVTSLPTGAPGVKPWLASQEAASMLKAEVYLWLAKRAGEGGTALSQAKAAIDKVLLSSYVLESNFEDAFRKDNSKEIIFSIYFDIAEEDRPDARDKGQYGCRLINNINHVPSSLRDSIPYSGMTQWFILSEDFIDRFLKPDNIDQRSAVSWQDVTPSSGGDPILWVNKYIGNEIEGTRLFYDDIRIYRMAEAYLFKAEVENALNNKDAAVTNLNLIAKRAYGIDDYYPLTLTKEQVDSVILEERLLEFVAEGKSWLDIIRFGKAFEIIAPLIGRESDYQGNILLFPVNSDVISRSGNKITQTPGY